MPEGTSRPSLDVPDWGGPEGAGGRPPSWPACAGIRPLRRIPTNACPGWNC